MKLKWSPVDNEKWDKKFKVVFPYGIAYLTIALFIVYNLEVALVTAFLLIVLFTLLDFLSKKQA